MIVTHSFGGKKQQQDPSQPLGQASSASQSLKYQPAKGLSPCTLPVSVFPANQKIELAIVVLGGLRFSVVLPREGEGEARERGRNINRQGIQIKRPFTSIGLTQVINRI